MSEKTKQEMSPIVGYKAFDKNLQCRGFQYEVGKEYEIDGRIKVCERGFHACESPLEVFDHYDMLNSRFCKVEQTGYIDKEEGTTKICSSKIKIVAELKLADMIRLGVEWLKERTTTTKIDVRQKDSGGSAQIGSTGENSVICCAGANSLAKAKKGSWITLSEWIYDENTKRDIPVCVKTEYVD